MGNYSSVIRRAAGFTMMELLMVMIVLNVLASIALPQYKSFVEKARSSEGLNMIGAIRRAEVFYKLENGNYTSDLTQLWIKIPGTGSDTYWSYSVSASGNSLQVTATRTAKKAAGHTGETMTCTFDDTTGASTWSGTYTDVIPKG